MICLFVSLVSPPLYEREYPPIKKLSYCTFSNQLYRIDLRRICTVPLYILLDSFYVRQYWYLQYVSFILYLFHFKFFHIIFLCQKRKKSLKKKPNKKTEDNTIIHHHRQSHSNHYYFNLDENVN